MENSNNLNLDKIARVALKIFIRNIKKSALDISLIEETENIDESFHYNSNMAHIENFNVGLLNKMCAEMAAYITVPTFFGKKIKRVLLFKERPETLIPVGISYIPPFSMIAFSGLSEAWLPSIAIRITYKIEWV